MTRSLTVLALVLSPACAADQSSAAADPPGDSAAIITAEVHDFLGRYVTVMNAVDTAALRTLYVADDRFSWVEDGDVRYESADAVIKALGQFAGSSTATTSWGESEVTPLPPSTAAVRTGFRTGLGPEQGNYEFGGMITMVLEQRDGAWRIVTGHTSTERQRGN